MDIQRYTSKIISSRNSWSLFIHLQWRLIFIRTNLVPLMSYKSGALVHICAFWFILLGLSPSSGVLEKFSRTFKSRSFPGLFEFSYMKALNTVFLNKKIAKCGHRCRSLSVKWPNGALATGTPSVMKNF